MTLTHRWRKQHAAARREETQRIRRYEREPIARSLHDTYLQSVQGSMLSTDAAVKKLPTDGDVRTDFEALLLRMSRVLAEGRDQLSLLRCAFISSREFRESLLRDLELMVPRAAADEGSGFGEFVTGRPGHYGMQGMRERSSLLGAELEFSDLIGRGARVTLTPRATLAYRGQDRAPGSRTRFDGPIPDYAGSRPDAW